MPTREARLKKRECKCGHGRGYHLTYSITKTPEMCGVIWCSCRRYQAKKQAR